MRVPCPLCLFALLGVLAVGPAHAKIINAVTLEQIVKEQPIILTATVSEFLPDKPGLVFTPGEKLRGEFAFDRVPVNLTGDKEAAEEKQSAMLLERLDKDVPLLIFASRRGKVYDAVAYTNGTWFRMAGVVEQQEGKDVTRWRFTHAEPYFRRTFKGTTEELVKAVQDGIKGGKVPGYDEKEKPGYGPPIKKKDEPKRPAGAAPAVPLGVIQLPFLGLIAALAALFPTVFGGAALLMKRWVVALSVASFVSMLAAVLLYFPNWIEWTGLKSLGGLWFTCAAIAAVGALWAGRRYRKAQRDGKGEEYQPRYLDRVGLAVIVGLGLLGIAYASITKSSFRESPFLELALFLVPATACGYFVMAHWYRHRRAETKSVGISAESVGLWAGAFACTVAAVALSTGPAGVVMQVGESRAGVRLAEQPLWVFEPKEGGEVVSTPCVTPERIYVAVHHRQGFGQYGRVYALNPGTGDVLWEFDDETALKPLFCSPTIAEGRLYFGEGYHTDRESKMFCVDVATGKKLWDFPTASHTESSPAVAAGKVVFGAGDDGIYCLDARTGAKHWQYPAGGGVHVDSNLLIVGGRVYAGSGTSKKSKANRIFCLDLATGTEIWGENVAYSSWGSPAAAGKQIFFPTGNGTFSEDREPVAGLLLCRDIETGKPIWERAVENSLVCRPAVDRYQVYVGSRDGHTYALDRYTGEMIWKRQLGEAILASPTITANPATNVGEVLYAISHVGIMAALAPSDGAAFWMIDFRALTQKPYIDAVSTPVVVRTTVEGKPARRVYVGIGMGLSQASTPTARLYCFQDVSE